MEQLQTMSQFSEEQNDTQHTRQISSWSSSSVAIKPLRSTSRSCEYQLYS